MRNIIRNNSIAENNMWHVVFSDFVFILKGPKAYVLELLASKRVLVGVYVYLKARSQLMRNCISYHEIADFRE